MELYWDVLGKFFQIWQATLSDKAKLFAKNFSKNSNDSGISLPVFHSRTNLKLHNISVTLKMIKKVQRLLVLI